MLTRFDTVRGRLAASEIKPADMTKAKMTDPENPRASKSSMTMGVRISAAPSLVSRPATTAPNSTISVKSKDVRPLPQRAICSAAHLKNPASSSMELVMMIAMSVAVAFQRSEEHTSELQSLMRHSYDLFFL